MTKSTLMLQLLLVFIYLCWHLFQLVRTEFTFIFTNIKQIENPHFFFFFIVSIEKEKTINSRPLTGFQLLFLMVTLDLLPGLSCYF